ncbi:LysR family transcriptional regulator [Rhodovulum sp. DZ06]|uniref:LysR family transcriptional regulator n=1 Tax=Rhodovulum sp. DZ06 TaxID=3425126 RepID=UPI003D34D6D4
MAIPRRFLPDTAHLAAFEATARLGSATEAAAELGLTQSAVSRQVAALEKRLGVDLFLRANRRLTLTRAGETYAQEVARALSIIGAASQAAAVNPDGGVLSLAILPTFGARWLAPRLPRFLSAHPGVTVNLSTALAPFDLAAAGHDAALTFGEADWPGAVGVELMKERMAAMCAPAMAAERRFASPADIAAAPRLDIATRPHAWADWFAAHGAPPPRAPGMVFDHFAAMSRAAMSGVGVALLPLFMTETELARGELVVAFGHSVESRGAYRMVSPAGRPPSAPLQAFRDWLLTEAQRGRDGVG